MGGGGDKLRIKLKIQNLELPSHFSKVVQWARLEPLPGQFWPVGLMFDTPLLY